MAKRARKARKKAESASLVDPSRYEVTKIRGADGKVRHSRGNQDAVAKALLVAASTGVTTEKIAKANGLSDRLKALKGNAGTQRMSLGMMLRKLVRDGTHVIIGDVLVKSLEQRVAVPKVETKAAA